MVFDHLQFFFVFFNFSNVHVCFVLRHRSAVQIFVFLMSVLCSIVKVLLSFSVMFMAVLYSAVEVLFSFSAIFMSVLCSFTEVSFRVFFVFFIFSNVHVCFVLRHVQFLYFSILVMFFKCILICRYTCLFLPSLQNYCSFFLYLLGRKEFLFIGSFRRESQSM